MKTSWGLLAVLLAAAAWNAPVSAQGFADDEAKLEVRTGRLLAGGAYSFPLQSVRLLDGPFRHAMELDEKYLLALDADRLLHNFRINAGLPSSAQPWVAGRSRSASCAGISSAITSRPAP